MTTRITSPEAAAVSALAAYLKTAITGDSRFALSDVVDQWPEPNPPLELGDTRIIIAISRDGAAKGNRLGAPPITRVTPVSPPTTPSTAVVRTLRASLMFPITLGVWASTRAMRDDADDFIDDLLNQPYWNTVVPLVNTTTTAAIAAGTQTVVPVSMADLWPGRLLSVDSGANLETVRVISTTYSSFVAAFTRPHAPGVQLLELKARRQTHDVGLALQCPNALNAVASFDIDDPVVLDDGPMSQRQEWRSVRQGDVQIPHLVELTAMMQQSVALVPTFTR